GILNGQSFSITFSCVNKSCWPGGLNFNGRANVSSVPEPGTIALMITGLGALVSRRKTWKNRWNS
ncbi:MAG: PEP-CTERM sorting domain-containing protein, partial [Terriglobales bacterium]